MTSFTQGHINPSKMVHIDARSFPKSTFDPFSIQYYHQNVIESNRIHAICSSMPWIQGPNDLMYKQAIITTLFDDLIDHSFDDIHL